MIIYILLATIFILSPVAIMSLISIYFLEIEEEKEDKHYKNQQKTYVYCPKCRNELCANGNLIKDTDFVYYKCSKCGHESKWDFDAPCPILIKEEE